MLKAALAAQARGFHIFPVARHDKIPHRLAGKWGETATNDINQIIYFWTQVDPQANIGVACKPSQLLVVDLDQAKEDWKLRGTEWEYLHEGYGPRVSGEEVWDEMTYKLGDPLHPEADFRTYSVRTGSGGLHLYYRWPRMWPRISQASPVKGIVDVRGNGGQYGGYVLAEGSLTAAGSYLVDGLMDYAPTLPPQWVRQLVAEKPKVQGPPRYDGILQTGPKSWSGLVDTVQNAGEGNRNNSTVWAARTMCEEGATVEEALRVLGPAAESSGLGWMEIERTIRSAYRTQEHKNG